MPSITLKTTGTPQEGGDSQRQSQQVGPLFRGNGDTDYLCGNCGFVIASDIGPTQRVPFDSTRCPACGAANEFPPELRS
jgi:hypothetical protein